MAEHAQNLIGRDLLCALDAKITMTPRGLALQCPVKEEKTENQTVRSVAYWVTAEAVISNVGAAVRLRRVEGFKVEESCPHISLYVYGDHRVRELGREVQKSWRKDWVKTQGHWVSSDGEMELYKFDMSEEGTREEIMKMEEYVEKEMMGRIPEELWAKGDYDIGKLKCNQIEIKIKQGSQRPFR